MSKGILYGLGVGPGDPELVTLKAVRLLKEADVIAVPDKGKGEKTALNIVRDYVDESKLLYCPTPMVRDREQLEQAYEAIAQQLCDLLQVGKNIAFITLGDPTVYSTYYYIHQKVEAKGFEAQLIPGVPSFCAVAARLDTSLCEREQRLLIIPASYDATDCNEVQANKIYMKSGKDLPKLKESLRQQGKLDRASLVVNCGMPGEQVWQKLQDAQDVTGYYSIVLVKEES